MLTKSTSPSSLRSAATESPMKGFFDDTYEEFVFDIKKRNPKLRIDI